MSQDSMQDMVTKSADVLETVQYVTLFLMQAVEKRFLTCVEMFWSVSRLRFGSSLSMSTHDLQHGQLKLL